MIHSVIDVLELDLFWSSSNLLLRVLKDRLKIVGLVLSP